MSAAAKEQRPDVGMAAGKGGPRASGAETELIDDQLRSLREAIDELRARQGAHEDQLRAVTDEMASMRGFRKHAETELVKLRIDLSTLGDILDELARLPLEVRLQFEPEMAEVREQLQLQVSALSEVEIDAHRTGDARAEDGAADQEPEGAAARERADVHQPTEDKSGNEEGRRGDSDEGHPEDSLELASPPDHDVDAGATWPPATAAPFIVPALEQSERLGPWLADAIRAVARKHDASLAAELIVELLPAQGASIDRPFAYAVSIEELGAFTVHLGGGLATVTRVRSPREAAVDFTLEGSASAFASLVGGGARRKQQELQVHGSRRKARRLLKACRPAVGLRLLIDAGITVWPGLLLPALAESVDPRWTMGHDFSVVFAIAGQQRANIYVGVDAGRPLSITAVPDGEYAGAATVYTSERAFMRLAAGLEVTAEESVYCDGEVERVRRLLSWFARGQGLKGSDDAASPEPIEN